MTTINDTYIKRLMYAVHHWLSYTATVSQCDLLAESSLRFPICEYIERHANETDKCEIEVPFSVLSDNRRKIDIVWNDESVLNCLELKFVSKNTSDRSEKQRIFNDLCRLYIALQTQTTTELNPPERKHCYFAICGDSNLFITKFQQCEDTMPTFGAELLRQTNDKTRATGDVGMWFSFKEGGIKEVDDVFFTIKHPKKKGGKETPTSYYNEFKKDYIKIVDNEDFVKKIEPDIPLFYTKLIGYIDTSSDNTQTSQSIAIWEIMDSNNIEKSTKVMNNRTIINHLQKMNDELESLKVANNNLIQQIQHNNEEKNQIES